MDKLDALADAAVKAPPLWRVKSLRHALLHFPLISLLRTRSADLSNGSLLRGGYGGVECLLGVESLSEEDVQFLVKLLSPDVDIRREILTPLADTLKPDSDEFLLALKSISTKREMASLLRHYGAQDLARKVFGMTTLMKRLLDKYRTLETSTQRSSSQATRRALKDFEEVRADYSLLQKYWYQEAENAKSYIISELEKNTRDYKHEDQEHERQEHALQARITRLESDHDELQKVVYDLENRLKASALDPSRLTNSLHRHDTRVGGNWPRLKALLERFRDHQDPPEAWKIQIFVNTSDDPTLRPEPYVFADENDDSEEKQDSGDSRPRSGSNDDPVDFSKDPPSPLSSSLLKSTKSLGHSAGDSSDLQNVQWRPTSYTPNGEPALDTVASPLLDVSAFGTNCAQTFRFSCILVLTLDQAEDLIRSGQSEHSRIPSRMLSVMLSRMMYWKRLDDTPWTRFVPSWCYKNAESRLEADLETGNIPSRWPPLSKQVHMDDEEIHKALFESDGDDNEDDPRAVPFTPKKMEPVSPRRTTSPREANRRSSVDTSAPKSAPFAELRDDEESSSKVSSASSSRKPRPTQERKQSQLARKDYKDILPMERRLIETPRPGVHSWRHYGILVKFAPGTTNALEQSYGFPDYAPNLSKPAEAEQNRLRWKPADFMERSKYLALHTRTQLSKVSRDALDEIVEFMSDHRRAFWWIGHWIFIYQSLDDYSSNLAKERKTDQESYKRLVNKWVDKGMRESLLEEPGVWTYPSKRCHWILMDPSYKTITGTPYSLEKQVKILDQREPSRVQWNTCQADADRVKDLPQATRDKLLPVEHRKRHLVTLADFD
ncbi:LOW QUALITY PROTEIN: Hypothetical protein PHPALM_37744 [Phytophthora palmivora]|uniref:Uncharacterized protein n=1 Tax=Phytophthora palmivora TaxID=4796 RepID=A0A2P4WWP1_9STRA|nr:LOW QUALITY PROTEIN: Hypothetical protein PHPALM_37744 [Phytophthora palmivora]